MFSFLAKMWHMCVCFSADGVATTEIHVGYKKTD